jgi:hypothetical protein
VLVKTKRILWIFFKKNTKQVFLTRLSFISQSISLMESTQMMTHLFIIFKVAFNLYVIYVINFGVFFISIDIWVQFINFISTLTAIKVVKDFHDQIELILIAIKCQSSLFKPSVTSFCSFSKLFALSLLLSASLFVSACWLTYCWA